MTRLLLISAGLLALVACKEDDLTLPPPVTMSGDALGFYCQMTLSEHPGPKAQVHLANTPAPLFFAQVRDAIAYLRMPEQDARITAIYVNDMGRAHSWDNPGIDNWIAARDAFFVLGSDAVGGMGAVELVPFSDRDAAQSFARQRGGRVVTLDMIPDTEVLAPDGTPNGPPVPEPASDPDTNDYLGRIEALKNKGNG